MFSCVRHRKVAFSSFLRNDYTCSIPDSCELKAHRDQLIERVICQDSFSSKFSRAGQRKLGSYTSIIIMKAVLRAVLSWW